LDNIYLELKDLANKISEELSIEINKIKSKIKIASIIIGNDPASLSYLAGMKKKCEKLSIDLEIIQMDNETEENVLLEKINLLNNDNDYAGIIVQVPLPKNFNFHEIACKIDYKKDLDGINPLNEGLLFAGKPFIIPATAWAVYLTLKYVNNILLFNPSGKTACIIGRSLTVGKPLIHLLLSMNLTVTTIHSKSIHPQLISSQSDILIAACGVPEFIDASWIKQGAIVIDVGIHSIDDNSQKGYKLCGDINQASVLKKSKLLTAVPGGIGSVTSTLICANAIKSYYKINKNIDFKFKFEE
jgi:methylenetetrahydrofolate dehydrogenase (NADP+)/methenyltetrahydrofolate cyclohydrolase